MHLHILGSSSSGNCALLTTENCKVLIEAGFSAKRLKEMLEGIGVSLEELDAVFLSHEHSDHAIGLRGLTRYEGIQFFANAQTAQAVERSLSKKLNWTLFETGKSFFFKGMEVISMAIPHDAYEPVGFIFQSGEDTLLSPRKSLAWVTDLGYVPEAIANRVQGVDILVLEANYDEALLEQDERRPFSVKQRIRGRHGHLSNEATCNFLLNSEASRWKHVVLAHLSKDCNTPEQVRLCLKPVLERPRNFDVTVVDPASTMGVRIHLS
jgi:phosphoribosyl 1,2-cyclic phosphodiesterase